MRDEARNTASHQSSWPAGDANFRRRPVIFVSAGFVEPLKDINPPSKPSEPKATDEPPAGAVEATANITEAADVGNSMNPGPGTVDDMEVETALEIVDQETLVVELPVQEEDFGNADQLPEARDSDSKELFFFDLGDDDQLAVGPSIPPPKIPSPRSSFGGSDSSEEVILFRGRAANTQGPGRRTRPSVAAALLDAPVESKSRTTSAASDNLDSRNLTAPSHSKRSRSRRNRSKARKAMEDDEEDAILADYIANMATDSDGDLVSQLQAFSGRRDLGGDDDAVNFGSGDEKSPQGDDFMNNEEAESVGSDSSDTEGDDDDEDMDADLGDEVLAQLYAKQAELGMEGDDLLLFSSSFAQTGSRKVRGKRAAKAAAGPASASQVADAFDNLDLADWGHLTGQTRKRRSKQPPTFNVSDSELEAALRTSWNRDRERKKGRKLERETLRAGGLLGKGANPDDMRVKYPAGMKLDDMKAELTSFLLDSTER